MAAVFVARTTQNVTAGTNLAVLVPAGTLNGHAMFTALAWNGVNGFTAPGGWTAISNTTTGSRRLVVYYRIASSEPASYNWTWTGAANVIGHSMTYSGVANLSPASLYLIDNDQQAAFAATVETGPEIVWELAEARKHLALFFAVSNVGSGFTGLSSAFTARATDSLSTTLGLQSSDSNQDRTVNPFPAAASVTMTGSTAGNGRIVYVADDDDPTAAESSLLFEPADTTVPVVTIISPTPNTAISRLTPIVFRITDDTGLFRRILPAVRYPGLDRVELMHDGSAFTEGYNRFGTQTVITNGFEYSVLPDLGWPDAPSIIPFAFDLGGNEPA